MILRELQAHVSKQINHCHSVAAETGLGGTASSIGMSVYKNNTLATRIEALSAIYAHTSLNLGDKYARQLFKLYVSETPSYHTDLNLCGKGFIDFIEKQQRTRKELCTFDYLCDLANADWLLHQAYYTEEYESFNHELFRELTPQQQSCVTFCLASDVKLFTSSHPLLTIISLAEKDSTKLSSDEIRTAGISNRLDSYSNSQCSSSINKSEYIFDKKTNTKTESKSTKSIQASQRQAQHFIIHCVYGHQKLAPLVKLHYELLCAIQRGDTFKQLVEIDLFDNTSFDFGSALSTFIQQGTINRFTLNSE